MKLLVISDIHQRVSVASNIMLADEANVDKVVFLGDYFDAWVETEENVRLTAEWVAANVKDDKNVFLLGNHDLSYAFPQNKATICSGYTSEKLNIIRDIVKDSDWARMKVSYQEGDILFSHAGVTANLVPVGANFSEWLQENTTHALKQLSIGLGDNSPLLYAGWSRGGGRPYGGIFWEDHSVHIPVVGIKQIYGHTILKEPYYRIRKLETRSTVAFSEAAIIEDEFKMLVRDMQLHQYQWSLCMDTNSKHYLIVDTEERTLTFKSTETWTTLYVQKY
jgi:hypothetical protein